MVLFLFAVSGVNVRAPNGVNNTGSGGICPAGHECPQGTAMPIPCVAGYYAKDDQMEACEICPPGKSVEILEKDGKGDAKESDKRSGM